MTSDQQSVAYYSIIRKQRKERLAQKRRQIPEMRAANAESVSHGRFFRTELDDPADTSSGYSSFQGGHSNRKESSSTSSQQVDEDSDYDTDLEDGEFCSAVSVYKFNHNKLKN